MILMLFKQVNNAPRAARFFTKTFYRSVAFGFSCARRVFTVILVSPRDRVSSGRGEEAVQKSRNNSEQLQRAGTINSMQDRENRQVCDRSEQYIVFEAKYEV